MKSPNAQPAEVLIATGESRIDAVEAFKEEIGRADGMLIPLSKQVDGKHLSITARLVGNPLLNDSPTADKYFYGWEPNRGGVGTFEKALLVDVYAGDDTSAEAIGHMDWWLQGDYANGGGNMHQALHPQTDYEKLSARRWGRDMEGTAFKLEEEYQGNGIGSLMIAASGVALRANGISRFYTGALLEPAQHAYARFGLSIQDFPGFRTRHDDPDWLHNRSLPIERLTDVPQADQIIDHFAA